MAPYLSTGLEIENVSGAEKSRYAPTNIDADKTAVNVERMARELRNFLREQFPQHPGGPEVIGTRLLRGFPDLNKKIVDYSSIVSMGELYVDLPEGARSVPYICTKGQFRHLGLASKQEGEIQTDIFLFTPQGCFCSCAVVSTRTGLILRLIDTVTVHAGDQLSIQEASKKYEQMMNDDCAAKHTVFTAPNDTLTLYQWGSSSLHLGLHKNWKLRWSNSVDQGLMGNSRIKNGDVWYVDFRERDVPIEPLVDGFIRFNEECDRV